MRHRSTDANTAAEEPAEPTPSPADIGRALRDKREALGLDLLTVHDRLGRPITQLEALEAGDLSRLHNQAFALSTLRRYARFLTLDGDALALQFMESLSAVVGAPTGAVGATTGVVAVGGPDPDHLRAFTQTGPVPRVGGNSHGSAFGTGGPPTGTLSVIPREQIKETRKIQRKVRRTRRAPVALRLATWLVFVALLVALAGVGIRHWRPQLLVQWHIVPPNGALYVPPTTSATTNPHHVAPVTVKLASTDNLTTATYTVSAAHFDVVLTTTAPCYVEVTSPASVNPIVEDVQPGNVTKSYPADGSLTVNVGAAEVSISVSVNGKSAFKTVPTYAPFSYTFNSAPGA